MQVAPADIYQITATVWKSILDLEVQRSTREVSPQEQEALMTGCIQIQGAWEMTVVLQCAAELAREAHSGRHVPIIAMTANAMQGDRDHAWRQGWTTM